MIKVSQLVATLLLVSASSYAAANYSLKGFYIGAGVGPDYANIDNHSKIRQINPTNGLVVFNVHDTNELAATGVFGTLFAGYGTRFSMFDNALTNMYLGGELNANWSSLEHKLTNKEYIHANYIVTRYKLYHSFGVSLLPGYLLTDSTLFYARIGYTNTTLRINTGDISLGNVHDNLNGVRWGLGIKQNVYQQFAVRMEYSHSSYNSGSSHRFDNLSFTTKSTKITPDTNEVEFSLIYNFC